MQKAEIINRCYATMTVVFEPEGRIENLILGGNWCCFSREKQGPASVSMWPRMVIILNRLLFRSGPKREIILSFERMFVFVNERIGPLSLLQMSSNYLRKGVPCRV